MDIKEHSTKMIEKLRIYESDFWNKNQIDEITSKINEIIDWIHFKELERAGDKVMNEFNRHGKDNSLMPVGEKSQPAVCEHDYAYRGIAECWKCGKERGKA